MKHLTRRSVTTGALAAVAAIPAVGLSVGAKAAPESNAAMMALWERFVSAELAYNHACHVEDLAACEMRDQLEALVCPWTPFSQGFDIDSNAGSAKPGEDIFLKRTPRTVVEQVTATRFLPGGVRGEEFSYWTVKEFQPKSLRQDDDNPERRWHPPAPSGYDASYRPICWSGYPEAKSGEEAYAVSVARAKKEWQAFIAKRRAIATKHERKYVAAMNAAGDVAWQARLDIFEAPAASALAVAIKLAVWGSMEESSSLHPVAEDAALGMCELGRACLSSIYQHAITECGFDPNAALWTAYDEQSKAHDAAERQPEAAA